ncbi:MAG: hypothetical protein V4642_02730 [Bacteroidota bacterium]
MNNCSHDIQNLHGDKPFLKGAVMRIFVMAMLLLSFVGCGSRYSYKKPFKISC